MDKIEKTDDQWREQLSPEQYAILRTAATAIRGEHAWSSESGVARAAP